MRFMNTIYFLDSLIDYFNNSLTFTKEIPSNSQDVNVLMLKVYIDMNTPLVGNPSTLNQFIFNFDLVALYY